MSTYGEKIGLIQTTEQGNDWVFGNDDPNIILSGGGEDNVYGGGGSDRFVLLHDDDNHRYDFTLKIHFVPSNSVNFHENYFVRFVTKVEEVD